MEYSSKMYDHWSRIPGHRRWSGMAKRLLLFEESDEAVKRQKVMDFYDQYGEEPTKKAFGVDRKLIYVWRKRVKKAGEKLTALKPGSTRPNRYRQMEVDSRIIAFIRNQREQYPKRSKEKLKPFVDSECQRLGLPCIAVSTIGKVIRRNNFFFAGRAATYHNPASRWAQKRRKKRIRVKHAPKPDLFGHLEMDTISRIVDALHVYVYTVIDVRLKFSFAYPYTRLNSQNTVDFFKKFLMVYPCAIQSIQTDNGLEFLGDFDDYLSSQGVRHAFTYPRCPRINGVIERYNRTLQEEFLAFNIHLFHTPKDFCVKLVDWLIYYNCYRVHQSLGLKSPMDYLILFGGMSNMSVTRTIVCMIGQTVL